MSDALAGRLLACDVDGTLLDSSGTLRSRTVDALDAAVGAGATVTLATGRDWNAVRDIVAAIPAARYSLCVNGSEVLEADGSLLHGVELDAAVAAAAVAALRTAIPGLSFGLGIDGDLVGEPGIAAAMPPGLADIAVVDDILAALGPQLRDVVIYHPDHHHELEPLEAEIRRHVDGMALDVARTGLPMIELVSPGSGKDAGLAWLASHLGVARADVVAFGDGMNDLAMLGWAGTGVAMGQAAAVVRAAADEVTAGNDDDGVAEWIESRLA